MFRNDQTNAESNFWISYADLMAGLLFVFILLIGAIVSKSVILKADLHTKEETLSKLSETLDVKEYTLTKLNKSLAESQALLAEKERLLTLRNARIAEDTIKLTEAEKQLQLQNARIAKDQLRLAENERIFKLQISEIKKLNKQLLEANAKQDMLSNKIVIVQNLLDENKNALDKTTKSLEEYEGKVVILSNELNEMKNSVKIKDEKLLTLLNAIDERKTKYDELVAKLQAQKAKIKSLTGIKLKVVAALKEALGDKIDIDKKTGSLRLASNILFGSGEATLKPEAKVELKKAFEEYIGTLVTNPSIKSHLDKIIIEGHTDSVGSYIYNLNLSQKRALAVMEYLLTLEFTKKHNIQPLMIASGRAYQDAIMVDGVEDKEASRRIEIKFRLKNEDAMHEIEKVLDAQ
ncbi:OmpA family protein [Sulfurovum sp. XTW-4]|uniref:OmpA family protein n=1 Tax=Sulfurovum xiamenensis TaxID=3019066 RepID=A0ABT7QRB7_9BACT|nr:OmpA family protein [Sulfurovum xiamenensis]MDM5263619.1 OmpA family protein [Sulfurovum xiamenensis]